MRLTDLLLSGCVAVMLAAPALFIYWRCLIVVRKEDGTMVDARHGKETGR